MNKETLTVEKDEDGTITYSNADGDFHNPYGPAVVYADGEWHCINDQLHNPDGPAVIYANSHKEYYINGEELTKAEFKTWQAQQSAPLHNTTATIDGIEYTLTAK
jgi:hypothetical protein